MLSKSTYQFIKSRITSASNGELLVIKDKLRELTRHPVCVDEELMRDSKKLLRQIDTEIDARYDVYLSDQRLIKQAPVSGAKLYPIRDAS